MNYPNENTNIPKYNLPNTLVNNQIITNNQKKENEVIIPNEDQKEYHESTSLRTQIPKKESKIIVPEKEKFKNQINNLNDINKIEKLLSYIESAKEGTINTIKHIEF